MVEETPSSSQVKSLRITPEEIAFLDAHDKRVHEVFRVGIETEKQKIEEQQVKEEKKVKKLTRQQKVQKAITNGVFLCIGLMFLWTLNFTNNIYGVAIVGGMAICFCVVGGIGLYTGMKAEGMFVRAKQPPK